MQEKLINLHLTRAIETPHKALKELHTRAALLILQDKAKEFAELYDRKGLATITTNKWVMDALHKYYHKVTR